MRGFLSKIDSLEAIIDDMKPDIVSLSELKTSKSGKVSSFFEEKGYFPLVRAAGGIAIAAQKKLGMLNVSTTTYPSILVGFIPGLNVRIINAYGPQETVHKEDRQEFFDELSTEIQTCEFIGNNPIILGDLNSKIDHEQGKISPNSSNGELLNTLLDTFSLKVMNFSNLCTGKWTRVQSVDGIEEKSVLDYCITNGKICELMESMTVDEEKLLCPFRIIKTKATRKQIFSDHNALFMTFRMTYSEMKRKNENVVTGWRMSKEGLENFSQLTSSKETEFLKDVNTLHDLEENMNTILDDCFQRKRCPRSFHSETERIHEGRFKPLMEILLPFLRKGKTEKEIAKSYIAHLKQLQLESVQEKRTQRLQTTVAQLTNENGEMSIDDFWKLRKNVLGKSNDRTSIMTSNGIEVFSEQAIINEYREEFIARLKHKTIHPYFSEYEEASNRLLDLYMQTTEDKEPDFLDAEVDKILRNLKTRKSAGPDGHSPEVYKNAGPNLVQAITQTLNTVKNTVKITDTWMEMSIRTLYKKKGSRKNLKYHRGIFLTCILSKVFERLLLLRAEESTGNIHPLQNGSRSGKSTADVMFITNGLIDHTIYLDKTLYITSYDFETCFDSLWLEDCLLCLWELGVNGNIIQLLRELNKTANITVKTPFGNAQPFETQNIVKQGTVWGSKLCCASTGQICENDSIGGASVGTLTIHSTVYVDDCNRYTCDTNDLEAAHEKFVVFSLIKRSNLNADKCVVLPINKKNQTCLPTLKIGDHEMKVVTETKILGDFVNSKGNHNSLIAARVKSGNGVMINMVALCNEVTIGFYQIEMLLLMYRAVFIPTVIFNSEAWSRLTVSNYDTLQTLQLKCLKRIMKSARSTPNSFVYLELGILPIHYEIHKKQLLFLHHILHLPDDDPVKSMYFELKCYPMAANWATNIEKLLRKYGLPIEEQEIAKMSREKWKSVVAKAIDKDAVESLIDDAKSKKKICDIHYSGTIETQQYLYSYSSSISTVIFNLRSRSVNCLKNRGSDGLCRLCRNAMETQEHAVNCPEVAEGGQYLNLAELYGEVPPASSRVREIVSRIVLFEEKIKDNSPGSNVTN